MKTEIILHLNISIVLSILFVSIGCVDKELKIYSEPISVQINHILMNKNIISSKFVYYIVENYKDTQKCNDLIEQFYCNSIDSINNYNDIYVMFLRKTKNTNFENLKKYPKLLEQYSLQNDVIFNYEISNGQFLLKQKFTEGNDNHITIDSINCPKLIRKTF